MSQKEHVQNKSRDISSYNGSKGMPACCMNQAFVKIKTDHPKKKKIKPDCLAPLHDMIYCSAGKFL